MRIAKNKKGQFIIIAVMMIALMIVSIGAIMYGAGTYYRYEQWEEYIILVEHVRLSTIHLVEISLANYTASEDSSILKANLNRWQNDLGKAYPGHGVILKYDLANATHQVYGTNVTYSQGLASRWNETVSYSAANITFTLDINSVGLKGYKFMATAFLNLTILNVDAPANEIIVGVTGEDGMAITNLEEDNFQVDECNITAVAQDYDPDYAPKYALVYIIKCETSPPPDATVRVRDQRGIQVIARA